MAERLEVREGTRGNPFERAVTVRELKEISNGLVEITSTPDSASGVINIPISGGLTASIAIDRFVDSIRNTRLYRDLMKRLDDPNRFDDLVKPIRDILLRSIADEAAARGADIRNIEVKIQDANQSLAMAVREITAALSNNSAGVRSLEAAYADSSRAQAVSITQLEASLGNYYLDGSPGRVRLEQQMTVNAERINGLRGQYTLKIQAGGALAGFGLAAEEVNGAPASAFIISADKFAVVLPSYSGGLTNAPSGIRPQDGGIPFGVDSKGIYLNNNVYVRGSMIVDASGFRRPLLNGLRGSVNVSVTIGSAWSNASARQAVWSAIGRSGAAPDDTHLVIGDTVTFTLATTSADSTIRANATKYWNGSDWLIPGVVINGNLLVDGSVAAQKIDTRGLTVRDANGNVILGSGTNLDWSFLRNQPSNIYNSNITLNANGTLSGAGGGKVTLGGLGAGPLATKSDVRIGSEVKFPDGATMQVGDFVSRLSKIGTNNISTFMESAAIGSAYIGNAAVSTLKIEDNAVTVPASVTTFATIPGIGFVDDATPGSYPYQLVCSVSIALDQAGWVYAISTGYLGYGSGWRKAKTCLTIDNVVVSLGGGDSAWVNATHSGAIYISSARTVTARLFFMGEDSGVRIQGGASVFIMGTKR